MKPRKIPGPDHPITVEPHGGRLTVHAGGTLVADTTKALVLREAGYEPVFYVPREDVDLTPLTRSETQTYCPYKGDASYYSLHTSGGDAVVDAVWTYEDPFPAVAAIANHLAFYPQHATFGENS